MGEEDELHTAQQTPTIKCTIPARPRFHGRSSRKHRFFFWGTPKVQSKNENATQGVRMRARLSNA